MPKLAIKAGTTSKLVDLFVQDSSSNVGAGLTGLAFGTASLTCYYYREGAASAVQISLLTMTLGTWTTAGFIVVDGTNLPGVYQLGVPDAAFAAGAKSCVIMLKGAANMAPCVLEIELTAVDNQSATAFVTGINSLAPPTNWNLESIDASGRLDVIKINGTSQTARDIGASVLLSSGAGTGQLDFTSGVVKANLAQILGTALTETAGLLAAGFKQFFNISSPTSTMNLVTAVTTLTTYTGNTPQTGDSYAVVNSGTFGNAQLVRSTTPANTLTVDSSHRVAEVALTDTLTTYTGNTVQTGDSFARIGAAGAGLTALGDARLADLDATVSSRSTYAGGAVASVTAAVTVGTNNDKTGYGLSAAAVQAIWDALTSALTTVGSIGKLLATNIDALISSRTKPADTQAAVTTVTNLTNAPGAGDFTATMKTSLNAATPAVTVTDKTGFALTSAYDPAKTAAQAGDAMALTSGERTTLTGVIWAAASRTLTSFGTLAADAAAAVWGSVTRTLSAFGFTVTTDVSSTVTTNLDATVSSRLATSGYTAPPSAIQNADALLIRNWASVASPAAHSVLNALRGLGTVNRVTVDYTGNTITVYAEDGTTIAYTIPITTATGITKTICGVTP